jgi:choice-of-anchor B domain-containing protein
MLQKIFLSVTLFYVTNGLRNLCTNWTNPLCEKVLNEKLGHTVEEIKRMRYLHALTVEERVACIIEGECPTVIASKTGSRVNCVNGYAGEWACNNVDLLSFVSLEALGSSPTADGNDIWGYTNLFDEMFAITGQTDGASIVDVTDPVNPIVLCFIPSRISTNTIWRDMKVIGNMAYIVADRKGQGLQWINLDTAINKCRASSTIPLTLVEGTDFGWTATVFDGVEDRWTNTHNIAANVDAKTVYIVGSTSCSGGLLAVDVSDVSDVNTVPQRSGCYSDDGYSHDTDCVIYNGPDAAYRGHNICFGYNEDTITIVDMTNGSNPIQISRLSYTGSRYTHQGWITPNHEWLLMDDELDENDGTVSSQTTYVVDLRNGLKNPSLTPWYSGLQTIDHNLYIRGNFAYEANYKSGLRILSTTNIDATIRQNKLKEVGYFQTYLGTVDVAFDGAWSSYPFFGAGANPDFVVVQDINTGLYVLDVSKAVAAASQQRTQ